MKRIGTLIVVTTLACSGEVGELPDGSDTISATGERATGTNPLIDAQYVGELPALPAGVAYTDLGVASEQLLLARSDRKLEVRNRTSLALLNTFSNVGNHVDWIQTGENWDLIAANDSTQQIRRKASSGSSILMGSYPAGTTAVHALAAQQAVPTRLRIYVIGGTWPDFYLQSGTHDASTLPAIITWSPTKTPDGIYNQGLTIAPCPGAMTSPSCAYRMINYTTAPFKWFSLGSPPQGSYEAGLAPNTEHAYTHPEGEYDRFAPVGFDWRTQDNYFYGIDSFYNPTTGRFAWVVARIHRNFLRP
jgi:hypothetical protein